MAQKNACIFNSPIDNINVMKHLMDFGMIKATLLLERYSSPEGLTANMRLTFKNAMTYNQP